jgi:hypothetical protein
MTSRMPAMRAFGVKTILLVASLFAGAPVQAWPEVWFFWDAADSASNATIDHSQWQGFLANAVVRDARSGINLVRYRQFAASESGVLVDYLAAMQAIDPRRYNRAEQMAYWINVYNAATVQVVLDHPDEQSIRAMGRGWFSRGPWQDKLLTVAGQKLTLDDIEHRILRAGWRDRRIHFAVNCASIGCPDLAAVPYTADRLELMLDQAERAYIRHPRGVSMAAGAVTLSSIFDWYAEDFASDRQGLLTYLAKLLPESEGAQLQASPASIRYVYDWSLNGFSGQPD